MGLTQKFTGHPCIALMMFFLLTYIFRIKKPMQKYLQWFLDWLLFDMDVSLNTVHKGFPIDIHENGGIKMPSSLHRIQIRSLPYLKSTAPWKFDAVYCE